MLGTDHGTAAPLFLFGSCIKNQILGDHPEIDKQVGEDDGVPMQYDFRDIYGTILKDWLGLKTNEVSTVINPNVKTLPLFKAGSIATTLANEDEQDNDFEIKLYPNPTNHYLNIGLGSITGQTKISVFDSKGSILNTFTVEGQSLFNQDVNIDVSNYPSGSYFIHLANSSVVKTKKFVKM